VNTVSRRIATAIAASATAAIAGVTLGAPAHAATTTTTPLGHTTIQLSDQDVQSFLSPDRFASQHACGDIASQVNAQRQAAHVTGFFSIPICQRIAKDCAQQVGPHTQIDLAADNGYTCTTYSVDGTTSATTSNQTGGMLVS
jgi:hypothetical protein